MLDKAPLENNDQQEKNDRKTRDNSWNVDREVMPFTTMMMNGRNELFPDPFDEFDPHHTMRGKKAFNNKVRCLQSKIFLKSMAEEVPSRRKVYSNVKPEIVEQFERICYDNYA